TLVDNTTGTTSTPLGKTCTNGQGWKQVTAAITGGHGYTLTLINRDDNYPDDPVYTLYDDVTFDTTSPPPPPPPSGDGPSAAARRRRPRCRRSAPTRTATPRRSTPPSSRWTPTRGATRWSPRTRTRGSRAVARPASAGPPPPTAARVGSPES